MPGWSVMTNGTVTRRTREDNGLPSRGPPTHSPSNEGTWGGGSCELGMIEEYSHSLGTCSGIVDEGKWVRRCSLLKANVSDDPGYSPSGKAHGRRCLSQCPTIAAGTRWHLMTVILFAGALIYWM